MHPTIYPGLVMAFFLCLRLEAIAQPAPGGAPNPPSASVAGQKGNVIRVAKVSGSAVMVAGGVTTSLSAGAEIPAGAMLRTPSDAAVILVMADGTTAKLESDSELAIGTRGSVAAPAEWKLNRGVIVADVKAGPARRVALVLQLPVGVVSAEQGVFRAVFRPADSGTAFTQVTCASGRIEFAPPGQPGVTIPQGQEIAFSVSVTIKAQGMAVVTAAPPSPASPAPIAAISQVMMAATDLATARQNAVSSPPPLSLDVPLSQATREKIARMRPLFDGRTLDGWIQAPPAPVNFSANDFTNARAFLQKLATKSDSAATLLADQFDDAGKAVLANPPGDDKQLVAALVKQLNRIVAGPSLASGTSFGGVAVRQATLALPPQDSNPQHVARLNRLLIEYAFSGEIAGSPSTSWLVKDGAMASTGGGRGVIYTREDFTRYRLIFTMRHVSGNPDHQPCVLVFCARPEPGEKGLDALGGIQFQTPNGGHWDYRPGHNNAGNDFFTRPMRTTFDNHQWHQVEILVDAKTGTARMAVAQPVGTRAIENCGFKDPSAGRTGPIAWQMHNAGLFDEYRDVRIEIDPKEDRLITVE